MRSGRDDREDEHVARNGILGYDALPFEGTAIPAWPESLVYSEGMPHDRPAVLATHSLRNGKLEEATMAKTAAVPAKEKALLKVPTDLTNEAVTEISASLRQLLADVFVLYLKTKNFHWHMTGRHFRDYHLLLDEHAEQIFDMTDDIAERARKIGGTTLRSISDISKHQRLEDNNKESVLPEEMLSELRADNLELTRLLRQTHEVCDRHSDVATASLIETWIDQTERRTWFLSEVVKNP